MHAVECNSKHLLSVYSITANAGYFFSYAVNAGNSSGSLGPLRAPADHCYGRKHCVAVVAIGYSMK